MVRISAHRNGDVAAVVLKFEGDFEALLEVASRALMIEAKRVFLDSGAEITDVAQIEANDNLYFSTGSDFMKPMKLSPLATDVISTLDVPARHSIIFYVNGQRREIENADPETSLLEHLRSEGWTSVKKPCGEGGCGGCAVAIARWDPVKNRVRHFAVNSCLVPLPFVDGCAITTAEGVGTVDNMHRIQRDLAEFHGTQCGFCSPGIVTTLYALFAENPERTVAEIDEALSTNLCRCTGYRPIFDAARRYAVDYDKSKLGRLMLERPDIEESAISTKDHPLVTAQFPEELMNLKPEPVVVQGKVNTWFKPTTLDQLSKVKTKDGTKAVIVSGSTDLSFKQVYRPTLFQPLLITTSDIKELKTITVHDDSVEFGAAVCVNDITDFWTHFKKEGQEALGTAFTSITKIFANYNIRNIGTIGGSLIAGDTLSDLCPICIGLNATCRIVSQDGERIVSAEDLVCKKDIKPNEILLSVKIPLISKDDHVKTYKIAKRREDAQSIVNACFNVRIVDKKVTAARFVIGAVAAKPFVCKEAAEAVIGKEWNFETFNLIHKEINDHITVSARVGMEELRRNLIGAAVYKFYILVLKQLGVAITPEFESASEPFQRKERSSKQEWTQRQNKVLGKQNPVVSAYGHATGEAKFVGDIAVPAGTAYVAPVQSTCANARIESIDASEALKMEGVIDFVCAADIPAQRKLSSIPPADEDVFADGKVVLYGQYIGMIVAESDKIAHQAALKVKVTYADVKDPIVTVFDAIEAAKTCTDDSIYLDKHNGLSKGEVPDKVEVECKVEGKSHINNQEHFYLEPNSILIAPYGTDGLNVYAACQNPAKIQEAIAAVLGLPRNNVYVHVMRLGGGFGGKQDRPQFYAAQAAIAYNKVKRPIKLMLHRQEDITTAGMRHEYLSEYKIGGDKEGNIKSFDVLYHSNGGCSLDLSGLVMDRTVYSATGCYAIPNTRVDSMIYRTNKLSCTAFRGFGVPQSLITIETAMAHYAHEIGVRPEVIKEKNLYHEGDSTMTGYVLPDDNTRACWFACKKSCDWDERVKEVEEFNAKHAYKKRGIAMVPVVSTMGFESEFMMKGGCLVQIYGDGTVSVSHGGIEMGQGVHTKMQMIAAETLGIERDLVKVMPTATDKVCNMPPTAGSTGTDLHGGAVLRACQELAERIQPIREAHPDWTWQQICSYGYFNKMNMQSSGFNPLPKSVYDHHTHEGRESYYLIWSVGFAEVELDVLTGEHYVVRADIVHDCGSSLNPAIDIGQLEGGFVQGQGLFTLEDMIWAKDGHIRTRNVTTYKMPTLDDIPDDFRVELLQNTYNNMGVCGSKASGEAGLRLGCAVFMALRDAVTAARKQFGVTEWFEFHSPATIEKIRAAMPVKLDDPSK